MKFRQSLFWDVDPKKIDPKKHARYIIERIFAFVKDEEARWMSSKYDKRAIKSTVGASRTLRPETKNLWQILTKTR